MSTEYDKMMDQVLHLEKQFSAELNVLVGKYINSLNRADLGASAIASGLTNTLGRWRYAYGLKHGISSV